jgi:hypothetical protein
MSPARTFPSELGPFIARYLALKEALGRRYRTERAVLAHLDQFLSAQAPRHSRLTAETFALWSAGLEPVSQDRTSPNAPTFSRRSRSLGSWMLRTSCDPLPTHPFTRRACAWRSFYSTPVDFGVVNWCD